MYHWITHQMRFDHAKLLFLVISHLGGLYSAVKMLKDRLAILFTLIDKMESGECSIKGWVISGDVRFQERWKWITS